MSVNEDLADRALAHAIDLQRLSAGERRSLLSFLEELQDEISALLVGYKPGARSETQRRRLTELLAIITETITASYSAMAKQHIAHLTELAEIEALATVKALTASLPVKLALVTPTGNQLKSIMADLVIEGAPVSVHWTRLAGDMAARAHDEIRKGLIAGETGPDLVKRIVGSKTTPALIDAPKRHVTSLVKTSTAAVGNTARMETYQQNSDVVKGVQQLSTLDGRTSAVCIAYSGKSWQLDGKPIGHNLPMNGGCPRHYNCRSVLIGIVRSWKELGIDLEEAPPGTRASLDGQVPSSLTFDQWLAKKDRKFLDQLLGPGRADLYARGKITASDLVDQTGRPMSLETLRAKYR
ncbi:phage head morphogenesis protein [Skermanella mucosa]|uniref:phage minor head protein n=1 Tax=Skermanella mucosa TaxID=1789672 RepID=UPI00192BE6B2|nr:phage minor head protein [Skermanella mucosa]UEM18966.1 phage head morphogenesis protein [Skermanella mucosa]